MIPARSPGLWSATSRGTVLAGDRRFVATVRRAGAERQRKESGERMAEAAANVRYIAAGPLFESAINKLLDAADLIRRGVSSGAVQDPEGRISAALAGFDQASASADRAFRAAGVGRGGFYEPSSD